MRLILCLLTTILVIVGIVTVSAQSNCECAKPLYSFYLNQSPLSLANQFTGFVMHGKDLRIDTDADTAILTLTSFTKIVDGVDHGGGLELASPIVVTISLRNIPKLSILEYWPETKEEYGITYTRKDYRFDNKLEITIARHKLPADK